MATEKTTNENVLVTDVCVNPNRLNMVVGEKEYLDVCVCPENATVKSVTWESKNSNIATVNATSGQVRAISPGRVRIYAKAKDGSDKKGGCIVVVTDGTTSEGTEKSFLQCVDEEGVKVRSSPSTAKPDIGRVSYCHQVELVQKAGEKSGEYYWHQIIHNGATAYVPDPKKLEKSEWFKLKVRKVMPLSSLTPISSNERLTQDKMEVNAEIIYLYLSYLGWSKNAICGLLGNMEAESTINPGKEEDLSEEDKGKRDPAYGLLQWDPASKWLKYAQTYGYEQDDLYRQLDYFIHTLRYGEGQWLVAGVPTEYQVNQEDYIASSKSAYDLAIAVLLCYERPADTSSTVREYRGGLAEKWKSYFDMLGY